MSRARYLAIAARMFAAQGFHGISLAALACFTASSAALKAQTEVQISAAFTAPLADPQQ